MAQSWKDWIAALYRQSYLRLCSIPADGQYGNGGGADPGHLPLGFTARGGADDPPQAGGVAYADPDQPGQERNPAFGLYRDLAGDPDPYTNARGGPGACRTAARSIGGGGPEGPDIAF